MKNAKKVVSLLLTVAMLFAVMVVPAQTASAVTSKSDSLSTYSGVQTVDVVLFSGQSNMDGFHASASDAPVDIKSGTAYQYNPKAGTITNLNEGPLYYKELTNPNITRPNTVGPVLTWCKTYYEKTGRSIVALNGAYGGTPISKFLPDTDIYNTLKANLNAAVAAVNADSSKKLGNVYLAWCQGESDIYDPNNYVSRFDTLFSALKADCGVSKAFVMNIGYPCKNGLINANQYGGYGNMQKVQREMCAANDDYIMVCDLLKYFTNYEYRDGLGIHFKQYIYNLAGEECGTKMAEYLKNGTKPELSTYTICPHTSRTLVETKVYDGDTVKLGYKKYKCANPDCILNTLVVKEDEKGIFYEDLVYSFDGCQHTFNTVLTDATCTEPPYRIATCTKCGMVEKTLLGDPLGHNYTETRTEATCTATGKVVRTCSRCDYKNETVIPAAGHKYTNITVTKPATCTEDGSQTGTCSVCGQTVTEKIPAKGHTWGEWTVVTPATKTSTGLKKHTCSVCSKDETEVIPMLNNDIVYDWDYTDTANGAGYLDDMLSKSKLANNANAGCFTYNEEGYLSIGGTKQINHYAALFNTPQEYAPSSFIVTAHNYSIGDFVSNVGAVIGKTTYSDGTERILQVSMNDKSWLANGNLSITDKKQVYNNDSAGISKDYILELKDPDGNYVTKSYTKAFGASDFKSTQNDRSDLAYLTYKYDIAVNEDNSVTVTVTIVFNDPDAAEDAQSVYTTTSKSITIDLNTLQEISSNITGFTPTFGVAQYFTNQFNNIPAKLYSVKAVYKQTGGSTTCEHKNTKTIAAVAATCTTAGKTEEVVCADCGAHISGGETTKALGHDYKTVTVESTCTVKGSTTTTCSRCDYKDVKELPLKDHTAAAERTGVKAATCTEEGYTGDVVCKDCGAIITKGEKISKADHTRSEWIIDTPATSTSNGSKHIECTVCGTVLETETIPATGRAYGDVNGDGVVDASDAMALLRYDALLVTLSDDSLTAADVNGDGQVDAVDAIIILQYDAKMITEFPVKTAVELPIDEH